MICSNCAANMEGELFQADGGVAAWCCGHRRQSPVSLLALPIIAESGLPGYVLESWFGLVAMAATSGDVISKLNADTVRGVTQPDVRERLAGQGLFVKTGTPKELTVLIQSEIASCWLIAMLV